MQPIPVSVIGVKGVACPMIESVTMAAAIENVERKNSVGYIISS